MFRADASWRIGHGHVMRCLTLANSLRINGAAVSFVSRVDAGDLIAFIRERGFTVHDIRPHDWSDDVRATTAAVERGVADWLVVDHYELDYRWESAARQVARRVMAIDDLANRSHDCDLLLDQNLVADAETRYDTLVPSACARAIGPRYALLDSVYGELHGIAAPRSGSIRRLLISFGGADVQGLALRALAAFLELDRDDVAVDVIAGGEGNVSRLKALADGRPGVRVHAKLPTLARVMLEADLAVGASGSTSWERLCLGLPSIVVTVAENQRPIAEELQRRGLIQWLGDADAVTQSALRDALATSLANGNDASVSVAAMNEVDGAGASRLAAALVATRETPLRARRVDAADEDILLEWANDRETRQNAFTRERISTNTHHAWFQARLGDAGCRFFVVEAFGVPMGQVRFQHCQDRTWEVHYAVAPLFRGRGLGRPMLAAAIAEFGRLVDDPRIVGRVRPENTASRRIFDALGFSEGESGAPDVLEYRKEMERT